MDLRRFPWLLMVTLALILGMGVAFLRSASYYAATETYDGYAWAQVIRLAIAMVFVLMAVLIPYERLGERAALIYLGCIGLLVAVFFVGREANGSARWIPLPFMDLQPSEVMKLGLIVVLARSLRWKERLQSWRGLVAPFAITLFPMALILKQPDLGSALLFLPVLLVMLYAAGARVSHLGAIVGAGMAFAPVVYFFGLKDYQKGRITAFLDPGADALGAGYQILQSLTAVGSGGLTGRGYGEGTQTHLQFLPERHTDFIFAVIAEEWGFLGAGALLVLFLVLFAAALAVAARTRDPFGRLIIVGVVTLMATQVVINTGMTVGLMPITGLTLPFVSYGGSSLLVSLLAMGLIVNVSIRPVPVLTPEGFRRENPLRQASYAL